MSKTVYNSPIIITCPRILGREAETLTALLASGAEIIHIRKPEATPQELEKLLQELIRTGAEMTRFTLHYNEPLARRYGLGGVHLRGNDLLKGAGKGLRRSCSAHTWTEARRWTPAADYVFLSPLFDSISKPGYPSGIDITQARTELTAPQMGNVVALGGIAPENIARVRAAGFSGAAVLGALWSETEPRAETQTQAETKIQPEVELDIERTVCNFQRLNRKWQAAGGSLQFISDGNMEVAEQFLKGGGRWIQLRMKDTPEDTIRTRGQEMRALCRQYDGALLLLNDNPALAAEIGADGVHLGRGDMSPAQAREIMGEGAIIGSTANTFEHIREIAVGESDYIGLGPFRYTTTKKNLSPILGPEGYQTIRKRMHEAAIYIPVVAIGGIELQDVPTVMSTGVTGIALSGAISHAENVQERTSGFLQAVLS